MVGVVGSSPIAPTNKNSNLRHFEVAFLFAYENCMETHLYFSIDSTLFRIKNWIHCTVGTGT
jgi:hypothetical protein